MPRSKRDFIRQNRSEIDQMILNELNRGRRNPHQSLPFTLNDSDREDHMLNNIDLYCWARTEGVNV